MQEYEYYCELTKRSEDTLSTCNTVDVCFRFSQLLQSLTPEVRSQVSEYFYALTLIHRKFVDGITESLPYKPKYIKTRDAELEVDLYFITYTLSKLQSTILRGIIVSYMIDCLESLE